MANIRTIGSCITGLVMALTASVANAASSCEVTSPAHRVALVELYTSEGCSSCPPADKWLGALSRSGLSDTQVLPLAFHVDYWDRLGWPDKYADSRFTERQREQSFRDRASSIYTPQVVLDGSDYRSWWRASDFLNRVKAVNQQDAGAKIHIHANGGPSGENAIELNVKAQILASKQSEGVVRLHLAVMQDDITTEVQRGENAGKSLDHQRVVRHWLAPQRLTNGVATIAQSVAVPAGASLDKLHIAAFVQTESGEVLQAVACRLGASS